MEQFVERTSLNSAAKIFFYSRADAYTINCWHLNQNITAFRSTNNYYNRALANIEKYYDTKAETRSRQE